MSFKIKGKPWGEGKALRVCGLQETGLGPFFQGEHWSPNSICLSLLFWWRSTSPAKLGESLQMDWAPGEQGSMCPGRSQEEGSVGIIQRFWMSQWSNWTEGQLERLYDFRKVGKSERTKDMPTWPSCSPSHCIHISVLLVPLPLPRSTCWWPGIGVKVVPFTSWLSLLLPDSVFTSLGPRSLEAVVKAWNIIFCHILG